MNYEEVRCGCLWARLHYLTRVVGVTTSLGGCGSVWRQLTLFCLPLPLVYFVDLTLSMAFHDISFFFICLFCPVAQALSSIYTLLHNAMFFSPHFLQLKTLFHLTLYISLTISLLFFSWRQLLCIVLCPLSLFFFLPIVNYTDLRYYPFFIFLFYFTLAT